MKKIGLLLLVLQGFMWIAWAQDVAPSLPVEVASTDANILYIGRFDRRDPAGPRCSWSASSLTMKFSGGSLRVKLTDLNRDFWQIFVNGEPKTVLEVKGLSQWYPVVTDLPSGDYTIELVKRTEAFCGTTQILGFQMSQGSRLSLVPAAARRIEVIGDSISCGYGNEGPNEKEGFKPETENSTKTYGALTARKFAAEYVCVAWSGRKLWPDNTIVSVYDLTLPWDTNSTWSFDTWQPDVVLINLGTNDFAKENPDEAGWVNAYKEFLTRLRKNYPNARIYCATGSMMSDAWPPERKTLTTLKRYIARVVSEMNAAGDTKIAAIHFSPQNAAEDGLGSGWHPSAKTHQRMADVFIAALQRDLGW